MDRNAFEAELKRDGFAVKESSMAAGTVVPDHTHPFDARLFVLSGEITIGKDGKEQTYGPGGSFEMNANVTHSEMVGDQDVTYVVGRRGG